MTKFQNKFRIESARIKSWNYSNPWWYYVTISTKNHVCYFGDVVNRKMVLNDLGKITEQCWNEIPKHYPNVGLDYCVIMPNHVHGIIIINDFVETGYIPSLRELKKHSLGGIVGKFKAAVTREIRKSININFHWQSQFYDRPKQ